MTRAPPSIDEAVKSRLSSRYGANWPAVAAHARGREDLLQPLAPECSALGVEVVHAVRAEMGLKLEDIAVRRLGLDLEARENRAVLERVAAVAAPELGWDATECSEAVSRLYPAAPVSASAGLQAAGGTGAR